MQYDETTFEHNNFTVVYRLYETSSHPETLDSLTDVEIDSLLFHIDEKKSKAIDETTAFS
jgi:hypothetical protein